MGPYRLHDSKPTVALIICPTCRLLFVDHNIRWWTGKESWSNFLPLRYSYPPQHHIIHHPLSASQTNNNNNLDWGPVPHFCPLETLQPVWLTPEVYCIIPVFLIVPTLAARCHSRPQPAVAPLAATGGTMGGNSGQIMPGICTQGSLTCRKSATWDR
jgi:hypothetical protein